MEGRATPGLACVRKQAERAAGSEPVGSTPPRLGSSRPLPQAHPDFLPSMTDWDWNTQAK